ncbi:MAG: hypothetical protein ACPG7F_06295 [Aggregatilineales bacterium]
MSFKYEAFDPNVEIIGAVMLALIQSIRKDDIQPYLKEWNLTDIQPDKWYQQQRWLNVLTDIGASSGESTNLFVSIGMKIAETAPFLPGFMEASLEDKYLMWNDIYQNNHRGGDAGIIRGKVIERRHVEIDVCFPYPDHLEYGAYYGLAKRFLPPGTPFTVRYKDANIRRELGSPSTIYVIQW